MYRAIQHIPTFVDGPRPKKANYNSLEELLQVDWVRSYLDDWDEAEIFVQSREKEMLLVANKDHTWWWVVAHVSRNSINELPICEYNE